MGRGLRNTLAPVTNMPTQTMAPSSTFHSFLWQRRALMESRHCRRRSSRAVAAASAGFSSSCAGATATICIRHQSDGGMMSARMAEGAWEGGGGGALQRRDRLRQPRVAAAAARRLRRAAAPGVPVSYRSTLRHMWAHSNHCASPTAGRPTADPGRTTASMRGGAQAIRLELACLLREQLGGRQVLLGSAAGVPRASDV